MFLQKLFKKAKQPNYFLYTSTYSEDFRDFGLYDNEEYRSAAHKSLNKLYKTYLIDNNITFSETEFDKFFVYCFLLKDKRKDSSGRMIYSLFGVVVDKRDTNFDVEELKEKVKFANLGLKNNVFDFAKKFPLVWINNLKEVRFHET